MRCARAYRTWRQLCAYTSVTKTKGAIVWCDNGDEDQEFTLPF